MRHEIAEFRHALQCVSRWFVDDPMNSSQSREHKSARGAWVNAIYLRETATHLFGDTLVRGDDGTRGICLSDGIEIFVHGNAFAHRLCPLLVPSIGGLVCACFSLSRQLVKFCSNSEHLNFIEAISDDRT